MKSRLPANVLDALAVSARIFAKHRLDALRVLVSIEEWIKLGQTKS
jgi:hypothetical protein